jgi:hypothetical protein
VSAQGSTGLGVGVGGWAEAIAANAMTKKTISKKRFIRNLQLCFSEHELSIE